MSPTVSHGFSLLSRGCGSLVKSPKGRFLIGIEVESSVTLQRRGVARRTRDTRRRRRRRKMKERRGRRTLETIIVALAWISWLERNRRLRVDPDFDISYLRRRSPAYRTCSRGRGQGAFGSFNNLGRLFRIEGIIFRGLTY